MTNYLYNVDVRQLESVNPVLQRPTQEEVHLYVVKELNFFKGQLSDEQAADMHVIAIPVYQETSISFID